jgi:hypothetical protein
LAKLVNLIEDLPGGDEINVAVQAARGRGIIVVLLGGG